jgi:hypothetical protein
MPAALGLIIDLGIAHRNLGQVCVSVCGRFITNRSGRASKDHHCIFELQTSSHRERDSCLLVLIQ